MGAPGLLSLHIQMWGVCYMYRIFVWAFPHPSFSSIRFSLGRGFSDGHKLAPGPKTIGMAATPVLHFCSAHPKILWCIYCAVSVFGFVCFVHFSSQFPLT